MFGRTTATFTSASKIAIGGVVFSFVPGASGAGEYKILHVFPDSASDGKNRFSPAQASATIAYRCSNALIPSSDLCGGRPEGM